MRARYDVAIVGAGPAGLATACLASRAGLSVALIEHQPEAAIASPQPDGRDIALTHRSIATLKRIGAWERMPEGEASPITRAAVSNAGSGELLNLADHGAGPLGVLVGNDVIRLSLYQQARAQDGIDWTTGTGVTGLELGLDHAGVGLSDGSRVVASLVVAADSRFSETRRMAGIGADMKDFGRVCIVSRMRHEKDHDGTAHEWFDVDQTLAVLPLNGRQSSIVLTLASSAGPRAMAMTAEAYAADVERRFKGRWGRMALVGERHAYPLVAVYAHRFHARRFALVGDAAVGMHPVTAHGFNFGLRGADTLLAGVVRARQRGLDFASEMVLAEYDRDHRHATWPLYLATNALVGLYTSDGLLAGLARNALLRLGDKISPVKSYLVHKLTESEEARATG